MAGRPQGSTTAKPRKKSAATPRARMELETGEQVVSSTDVYTVKSVSEEIANTPVKKVPDEKKYKIRRDLDPRSVVTVYNGFQGKLIYRSRKTGEKFVWDEFGDEQDMELQELKNARNSSKDFFANNWFLIEDPEVIECLGVQKYYAGALRYGSFDELFEKSPDEIEAKISSLSRGQKQTVAYRARMLIEEGTIDSIKVINALEKSLSIELIER